MGCGTSRTVATATAEGPLPDDANGGHSGDQALNTAGSATWIPVTTENKSDGDMDPLHSVCSCHGELPAEEFVEAESWLEAMDNAGMLEAAHTDGFSCKPQQDCPPLNYDLQVKPFSGSPRGTGRGALGPLRAGYLTDEHGKVMQVAIRYGYEGMAQKAIKFFRSALDMRQGISCHPNIVRCYGGRVNFKRGDHFGDQGICIVEELMYANLQDVLQEFDANMPLRLILKIALDVASGLEHLHRASVVKCDLKPTTIFVDEDLRTAKISAVDLSNAKGDMRPEDYAPSTFILSSDIGES
eukprot:evm.model.scf_158.5 EVM.evm.TU.scf_158.5   scf_158:61768-66023(+)